METTDTTFDPIPAQAMLSGVLDEIPADGNGRREDEDGSHSALAALVDKIGRGLARGLVGALTELEAHIAGETRRASEAVGRRLDALQESFHELADLVAQQNTVGVAVQDQCRGLAETAASLQESDARRAGELESLRAETREFSASVWGRIDVLCGELGIRQEELGVVSSTLEGLNSRLGALGERMDKQGDALRSLYSTYSQRESELEQVVEGLVRMRSYPVPSPASAL